MSTLAGVHGRLLDIATVRDSRYQLALTTLMFANMDAVVVDKAETAQHCISMLRSQRLSPMTFLALDTIRVGARYQGLHQ